MHKKVFLILCSIIVLGAVVNCGHDDYYYDSGSLILYNDTSLPISELYLTPAGESTWGPDQLSSDIPSGGSYSIIGIYPEIYDVKAVIIGTLSIYYGYIYNIFINEGETYDLYAYNSDFSGSFEIVNDAVGANIDAIYISPTGSSSWGPNQITSSIVPGDSIHLYDLNPDSYDVWIVWDVGPDSFYYSNIVSSLTLLTLSVN